MLKIPDDRCDAAPIKNALAYVHYWETRAVPRAQAAREQMINLSKTEFEILLRALHVDASEVRS